MIDFMGHSPDLNDEQLAQILGVIRILEAQLPEPIQLRADELEDLTEEQAMAVFRAARRTLLMQLLNQEHHEHMGDDCGDYLEAATDNFVRLWGGYFKNDGNPTEFIASIKTFLTDFDEFPLLGSDGEVRYSILPEQYIEEMQGHDGV